METWAGVVLAAGMGTRMKSSIPKILHRVCGQELVVYAVEALKQAGIGRVVVVVSSSGEEGVRHLLGESVEYVLQARALGTGEALLQAAAPLKGRAEHIVVLGADSPLIRPTTVEKLCSHHRSHDPRMTLLSASSPYHGGMAVIVRDETGMVERVEEAFDGSRWEGDTARELNAGAYCFNGPWLWDNLPLIESSLVGELYVTSLAAMANSQGARVEAFICEDPQEILGINDRIQLAQAEGAMRQRIRERWMLEGVTLVDPASIYIDAPVELGQDTVIQPNTSLLGRSRIGRQCALGPGTVIQDSVIGDGCKVVASYLEEAVLEGSVDVGPFSHLRPGAYLESGVHVGNFAEIKNSRLGRGVAMGHFGYVGDASIGAKANLGAGMVTCNFDGVTKHRTEVGEGALVGSDTMFVAPVKVGAGAITGAGAVITKDVPPHRLAVGVPATIKESKQARQQHGR